MISDAKRSTPPQQPRPSPKDLTMASTQNWSPSNQLHTGLTPVQTHHPDTLWPTCPYGITSPDGESGDSVYGTTSDFTTPSYDENQLLHFTMTLSDTNDQGELQQIPTASIQEDDFPQPPARQGLQPDARSALNQHDLPTLEEQERAREREAAAKEVQQWLAVTTIVDEEELQQEDRQRHELAKRVRAKSTSDAGRPRTSVPEERPDSWVSHDAYYEDDSDSPGEEDGYHSSDTERGANSPSTPVQHAAPGPRRLSHAVSMATLNRNDSMASSIRGRPWQDPQYCDKNSKQPMTSNAAMSRFQQRAKDIETASVTATIGTHRRRSEADVSSMYSATGMSIMQGKVPLPQPQLPPPRMELPSLEPSTLSQDVQRSYPSQPVRTRRPSFIDKIKRQSNHKKRGTDDRISTPPGPPPEAVPLSPSKRSGSLGKSRNNPMKIDTASAIKSQQTPWETARGAIHKIRSRSPSAATGLAEIWKQAGGPPVVTLGSNEGAANFPPLPPQSYSHVPLQPETTSRQPLPEDDDELIQPSFAGGVPTELSKSKIQAVPEAPTMAAFRNHILSLDYVRCIPHYMVERLAQEQLKRYGRLAEAARKHREQTGRCSSGALCSKGLGPRLLTPKAQKGAEGTPVVFYINPTDREAQASENDTTTTIASFPAGVPLPPVPRLPAEFECPLCFQVKKILKPSDWTKHVHEDVQPFTCTFPDCHDAKSFKRKADWVRHENERHRHLESWHCSIEKCDHKCFRKNNFQEHLVREHKLPEMRDRRALMVNVTVNASSQNNVAELLETCRVETSTQPEEEACRFCGERCDSWKKLHVHLASHLLQISMPVLEMRGLAEGLKVSSSVAEDVLVPEHTADMTNSSAPASRQISLSRQASISPTTQSPAVKQEPVHRVGSTYPPVSMVNSQGQGHADGLNGPYLSVPNDTGTAQAGSGTDGSFLHPASMGFTQAQTYPQPSSQPVHTLRDRQGSWLALEDTSPGGEQISSENLVLNNHLQSPPYAGMTYNQQTPFQSTTPDYSSPYGSTPLEVPQTTSFNPPTYFTSPPQQQQPPRPQTANIVPHQGTFFNEPDEFSGSEELSPRTTAQYNMSQQWNAVAYPQANSGWQPNYNMAPPPPPPAMHTMHSTPLMQAQFPAVNSRQQYPTMLPSQKLRKSASHMHFNRHNSVVTQPPTTTSGGWM